MGWNVDTGIVWSHWLLVYRRLLPGCIARYTCRPLPDSHAVPFDEFVENCSAVIARRCCGVQDSFKVTRAENTIIGGTVRAHDRTLRLNDQ